MLYKCVECGQEIAADAYRCPKCNASDAGYRASHAEPAAEAAKQSEYESEEALHLRLKAEEEQETPGQEQEQESSDEEQEQERLAAEAAACAEEEENWAKGSEDPKLVFTWMLAASVLILCLSLWLYFR